MSDHMVISITKHHIFVQHARPSDSGVPFAASPAEAANRLLRHDCDRVRMVYDVEAGREVKRLVRDGGQFFA